MALKLAEIFFNDSNSQANKDLTDFLKRNIEAIVTKGHLKLKCTIAGVKDHAELRQRGIKPLPAMVVAGSQPITTVPRIIEQLRNIVKASRKAVATKSEEEVLSDYFSKTLGPIRQNDEGRIIVPDEPEELDNGDQLINDLHREMARRGQATIEVDPTQGGNGGNGGNGKKKKHADRQPPPKPARDVERDNDEEDRAPPIMQFPGHMPRHDNIDAGDPLQALHKVSNNKAGAGGDAAVDDQLMSILLAKMSDEA